MGAILAVACSAQAQFTYTNTDGNGQYSDVLIGFRPISGSYDLVVDAGSVSNFIALTSGQKIQINPTYFSTSRLSYTGTNNIAWSASACQTYALGGAPTNTIWVTRPRSNVNIQTSPWPCKGGYTEQSAANRIGSIGNDAVNISSLSDPYGTSPTNGTSYVVEPEESGSTIYSSFLPYSYLIGGSGNLGGNFWGSGGSVSIEQTTPANFTSSGLPVRADFYQLLSTNAPNGQATGTYLGYFELSTNGSLTYTAGASSNILVPPTIVSITRVGTTTTVYFTTLSGFNYTLREASSLNSTPISSWTAVGSPLAGTGTGSGDTNYLTDVTSDGVRFYAITAQ
jgi:hypothetical protein